MAKKESTFQAALIKEIDYPVAMYSKTTLDIFRAFPTCSFFTRKNGEPWSVREAKTRNTGRTRIFMWPG